jgi:hypothetical protein
MIKRHLGEVFPKIITISSALSQPDGSGIRTR